MLVLYGILMEIYFGGIRLMSPFLNSAKAFTAGRKNWKTKMQVFNNQYPSTGRKRLWLHASSLGEFEQGRELLEKIRAEFPDWLIVLSFFSPSGFEKRKDYPHADLVCYFPSDRYSDVQSFLDLLHPDLVVFVKYDFWFILLSQLHRRKIPFFFISAIFRKNHFLLHRYLKSFLKRVMNAKHIFLLDKPSETYLKAKTYTNISVAGDTRMDRVYKIAGASYSDGRLNSFCADAPVLICGSVWSSDFKILTPGLKNLIERGWKLILVPHKIDKSNLDACSKAFHGQFQFYSRYVDSLESKVLIVDEIGHLAYIYRYASLAYVGGGFGKGIHNILEAAVYGIPVCFGPRYQKFPEAAELINRGLAYPIEYKHELVGFAIRTQRSSMVYKEKILAYFAENLGASDRIFEVLKTYLKP
ncbi:MAG: 3-deoxy-D-manno-octulosonic acid transferase [Saprospiraceae bacterium]|nr:3-deoxy-D-manno-octulosonic acid transferase [Saprospiraceae bacterium]